MSALVVDGAFNRFCRSAAKPAILLPAVPPVDGPREGLLYWLLIMFYLSFNYAFTCEEILNGNLLLNMYDSKQWKSKTNQIEEWTKIYLWFKFLIAYSSFFLLLVLLLLATKPVIEELESWINHLPFCVEEEDWEVGAPLSRRNSSLDSEIKFSTSWIRFGGLKGERKKVRK